MRLLLALTALLMLSCVGTEVGNPDDEKAIVNFEFGLETPAEQPSGLVLSDGVVVQEAWMVVDDFSLQGGSSCDVPGHEPSMDGFRVVELIRGIELPESAHLSTRTGEYCRFKMRFKALPDGEVLPEGAPAELSGLSILIRGVRTNGDRFEIHLDTVENFRFDAFAGAGFAFEQGQQSAWIAFALETWFPGLDIDNLPELIITQASQPQLTSTFKKNFKTSARLFRGLPGQVGEVLAVGVE